MSNRGIATLLLLVEGMLTVLASVVFSYASTHGHHSLSIIFGTAAIIMAFVTMIDAHATHSSHLYDE